MNKYLEKNEELQLADNMDALEDFMIIKKTFPVTITKVGEIIRSLQNPTVTDDENENSADLNFSEDMSTGPMIRCSGQTKDEHEITQ